MQKIAIRGCLLFVALLNANLVFAQPASAPRLATKDEYRACKAAEQGLDDRKKRLELAAEQFNQASAQHQAESSKYLADRQRAGLTTPTAVAAYNQTISRLNARAKELMAMQRDLMKVQEGFNTEVLRANSQCGGQMVSQDMADEVDAEIKKAPRP